MRRPPLPRHLSGAVARAAFLAGADLGNDSRLATRLSTAAHDTAPPCATHIRWAPLVPTQAALRLLWEGAQFLRDRAAGARRRTRVTHQGRRGLASEDEPCPRYGRATPRSVASRFPVFLRVQQRSRLLAKPKSRRVDARGRDTLVMHVLPHLRAPTCAAVGGADVYATCKPAEANPSSPPSSRIAQHLTATVVPTRPSSLSATIRCCPTALIVFVHESSRRAAFWSNSSRREYRTDAGFDIARLVTPRRRSFSPIDEGHRPHSPALGAEDLARLRTSTKSCRRHRYAVWIAARAQQTVSPVAEEAQ